MPDIFGFARRNPVSLAGIFVVLAFLGGFFAGYHSAQSYFESLFARVSAIRDTSGNYKFTRPLLAYALPEATDLGEYTALKASMQKIVSQSAGVSRASVYFRDLGSNAWVGINENDTYYPASLLKVPVMIAYLKEAEERPGALSEIVAYDPLVLPDVASEATSTLVAGRMYSVSALIASMIGDSDNGATFTLLDRLNPDFLHDVYLALGVEDPGDNSANYQISTRTYALFFRILYNATYLSPASSETALSMLAHTSFDPALVAGVPQGTAVAHKWGEHMLADASGNTTGFELHDCGIVYYPAHPYLLCVMTSADTLAHAESLIAHISNTAYASVANRYATTTSP